MCERDEIHAFNFLDPSSWWRTHTSHQPLSVQFFFLFRTISTGFSFLIPTSSFNLNIVNTLTTPVPLSVHHQDLHLMVNTTSPCMAYPSVLLSSPPVQPWYWRLIYIPPTGWTSLLDKSLPTISAHEDWWKAHFPPTHLPVRPSMLTYIPPLN